MNDEHLDFHYSEASYIDLDVPKMTHNERTKTLRPLKSHKRDLRLDNDDEYYHKPRPIPISREAMPFTTTTTSKKTLSLTPPVNMIPPDTEIFTSATFATYKPSDNTNADDHYDKDERNFR